MATRTQPDPDPLTQREYQEAEGFVEDRTSWTSVAIGLVALVAILAAITAGFALAGAGGGETTTVVKPAASAAPAAAAAAKAPTLAESKGVEL
jgi:hypothetical protein